MDFETYLRLTMELITTEFEDEKVRLIIEKQHQSVVEPQLTANIEVKHVDVADLRAWKHYAMIEKIRKADWWAVSASEIAASVQGTVHPLPYPSIPLRNFQFAAKSPCRTTHSPLPPLPPPPP